MPERGNRIEDPLLESKGDQRQFLADQKFDLNIGGLSEEQLLNSQFIYQRSTQLTVSKGERSEHYPHAWSTVIVQFDRDRLLNDHKHEMQRKVIALADLSPHVQTFKTCAKKSLGESFIESQKRLDRITGRVKQHFTRGRPNCLIPEDVFVPKRAQMGQALFGADKPLKRDLTLRVGANSVQVHSKFLCKESFMIQNTQLFKNQELFFA